MRSSGQGKLGTGLASQCTTMKITTAARRAPAMIMTILNPVVSEIPIFPAGEFTSILFPSCGSHCLIFLPIMFLFFSGILAVR